LIFFKERLKNILINPRMKYMNEMQKVKS